MIACDDCKEIEICSCENFCLAPANLTAGESYIVTIVDKFGIEYSQEIVANVYGTLCVDITGFPDGFFNPYIGSLLVTIQLVSAPDDDIQVVYNSINYTCISLKVKDCPNSVANPHTPAPEECLCFTDESQLQSDWNVANTNSVQYIRNKPTIPTGGGGQTLSDTYDNFHDTILPAGIDTTVYDKVYITDRSIGLFLDTSVNPTTNTILSGWYISGGTRFLIGYDFANDVIARLDDTIGNNHLSVEPSQGFTVITNFPLNQVATFYSNNIQDTDITISDVSLAYMVGNNIKNAAIDINDNGALTSSPLGGSTVFGSAIFLVGDSGGSGSGIDATVIYGSSVTVTEGGQIITSTINYSTVTVNNSPIAQCDFSHITIILTNENYSGKFIDKAQSTFNKSRTIAGSGAFDFTVAAYDESFAGEWLITAVAPRSVTSFTNQNYTHQKTFLLNAGSSAITFADDGVNIIMKGSANAVLATAGDFVTFRFVGNVAYEINRGIY